MAWKRSGVRISYGPQMTFGIDIAARRFDDLDKILLYEIEPSSTVLEVGCGSGTLANKLHENGVSVIATDITPLKTASLDFIQNDARRISDVLQNKSFDYAICQRMLHYLSYQEAQVFLKTLHYSVTKKLYISVSGLESEIGNHYQNASANVSERHNELTRLGKELFSIKEPVCLYTVAEFQVLLEETGWVVEKIWTSAFGNHKAIAFAK